jgi:DNA-binding CsgD family transcriptional regulator
VLAQFPKYELPERVEFLLQEGKDCFEQNGPDCLKKFDKAILEARSIQRDSVEALTYYSISSFFFNDGKAQDILSYALKGAQLNGNNHPTLTHYLWQDVGYAYDDLGIRDSLLPVYKRALYWAEIAQDTSSMAMAYIRIAGAQERLGDYKGSIQTLLDARPLAKASGDIHRESGLLFTLGGVYGSNQDYAQGMEKLDEAAVGFLAANDSSMYALSIVNWSSLANEAGLSSKVVERLQPLYPVFAQSRDEIYIRTQLARAYKNEKQFDKAIPFIEKNVEIAIAVGHERLRKANKKLLAQIFLEQEEGEKALSQIEEIYTFEQEKGVSSGYLSAIKIYADALTMTGKGQKAGLIYQEYITVNDSLFNSVKEKEIATMRELFDAERREAQIQLLEKEKETNTLQKGLLVAGLLAVLGIFGVVWVRFRESGKRSKLKRQKLDAELDFKKKELTTHALHLAKKNEILADIKTKVEQMEGGCETRDIINTINFDLKDEDNWNDFTQYFEQVHKDFGKVVQQNYPNVTPGELRLMALLKMNLTSKEIASMLNITSEGVKKSRQRLRKKLDLQPEDSLEALVVSM